ncbi:TPA: flagellar basal-body rod protein FlgG [bacterium]|nr:flagellar basal-body rod protein FlgG [bacterium]
MERSLWTAATGMNAQRFNLDIIANNLANVNTTGYKKTRTEFEDLLYATLMIPGTPVAGGGKVPTGIQVGHGVKVAGTHKIYLKGSLEETGNPLDLAIEGDGFFQVLLPDGETGYARAGSFAKDAEGRIVTSNGYILQPEIVIPEDATEITIKEDGTVYVIAGGDMKTPVEVGKIEIVRFINPSGLSAQGKNVLRETAASGDPIIGTPGIEGFGRIAQGFLEMSNVNVVEEMIKMIVAQRAYELNSKTIHAADSMLGVAATIRR